MATSMAKTAALSDRVVIKKIYVLLRSPRPGIQAFKRWGAKNAETFSSVGHVISSRNIQLFELLCTHARSNYHGGYHRLPRLPATITFPLAYRLNIVVLFIAPHWREYHKMEKIALWRECAHVLVSSVPVCVPGAGQMALRRFQLPTRSTGASSLGYDENGTILSRVDVRLFNVLLRLYVFFLIAQCNSCGIT